MRKKLREITEVGEDPLGMDWEQARRWTPDGTEDSHDDWREQKIEQLVERIIESGLATEMGKYPDFVMEALSRINPGLPGRLAYEMGSETIEWVLEQYEEDLTFKPLDAAKMADF
jgi:hypothetical protein